MKKLLLLPLTVLFLSGCTLQFWRSDCQEDKDCEENYKCKQNKCISVGCVWEWELTPPWSAKHMAQDCCKWLRGLYDRDYSIPWCESAVAWWSLCTAKCWNWVCDPKESKCTCPEDCYKGPKNNGKEYF